MPIYSRYDPDVAANASLRWIDVELEFDVDGSQFVTHRFGANQRTLR
jgi:hypothetical protein